MKFDVFSILAASSTVFFATAGIVMFFWLRNRAAQWFAWWAGALAMFGLALLCTMAQPFLSDVVYAGLRVAAAIAGFGMFWQSARVFEKRKALRWPIFMPPAIWMALFFVPAIRENAELRIAIHSPLMVAGLWLSAFELWRGRAEPLASRKPLMFFHIIIGLIFSARVFLAASAPFPLGGQSPEPLAAAIFLGLMFAAAIAMTVLLVSLTLERSELTQRGLARSDPLTGLLNRRALADSLGDGPLPNDTAVILFDLDRFKQINDRFGHAAGDEMIRRFTNVCRENLRQVDIAARLGGEEFAIILPETGADAAQAIAERVREAFAGQSFETAAGPVQCTVSAGIDISTGGDGMAIEALLLRADGELYRAKRSGRNQVCLRRGPIAA